LGGDVADSLRLDDLRGLQHPVAQAAGDGLFHQQKGLDLRQVLDFQRAEMVLQLDGLGHRGGQGLVGWPPGAAVAPLGEADHRIGRALTRQQEVLEPVRQRGAAGMVQVGYQEPDQQVLERRRLILVAEVACDEVPEGRLNAKLFQLHPGGGWLVQIALGDGVEQRDQDVEELRLVCLGKHRDDLAVDVDLLVRRADELFQAFEPIPVGEKLGALGEMLAQRLLCKPEVGEQHRGPVRAEARAVQPNVEQPILIWNWWIEWGVEQVVAGRVLLLKADLDGQCGVLVEAQERDAVQV